MEDDLESLQKQVRELQERVFLLEKASVPKYVIASDGSFKELVYRDAECCFLMSSLDKMPLKARFHPHKWVWPVGSVGWAECKCGAIARHGKVVGYRKPPE